MQLKTPASENSVRAVDRALSILAAFTAQEADLSAAQLLSRVELSRPTLYRLLYSLERSGHIASFISGTKETQRFRLGPAIAGLVHAWAAQQDLTTLAQPIMHKLWVQTNETVSLFVRQREHRLCVAELPSTQALSFKRGVGYREVIQIGASGQVMLAYSEELADTSAFKTIRKNGYAVSRGALIKGATAIAAPIFDRHGTVYASLAVFGPSTRLTGAQVKQIGQWVSAGARAMSRSL